MKETISRADRALIALHDHGTRDGATARSVMAAMKKDGFTDEEIRAATETMVARRR